MRYLISADKINDIIEKACEKIKLPSHQYKVILLFNIVFYFCSTLSCVFL